MNKLFLLLISDIRQSLKSQKKQAILANDNQLIKLGKYFTVLNDLYVEINHFR
jgi:hypothetical protein